MQITKRSKQTKGGNPNFVRFVYFVVKRLHAMNRQRGLFSASIMLLLTSCGFAPETLSWSDPRLTPLLKAVEDVDRGSLGFTPIDRASSVRLESRPRAGYDAMLHIYGQTSRTIAFRKTADGYKWIHEQETYTGQKTYTSVDGTSHEHISVTYGIEPVSGHAPNKLHIVYWGEDPRLPADRPLTLQQIRPIIHEWNKSK